MIWQAFAGAILVCLGVAAGAVSDETLTCSACGDGEDEKDPALVELQFDIGYGDEFFDVYVRPDVATFYQEEAGSRKEVQPSYKGIAGKFVNMGPDAVNLYWDPLDGRKPSLIARAKGFQSVGTATFPGHQFFFASIEDNSELERFHISGDVAVYYYDPITGVDDKTTQESLAYLTMEEYEKYERHVRTRDFAKHYRRVTGRDYLTLFPRKPPQHYMWRADYIGQKHWVTSRETRFAHLPPENFLGEIKEFGEARILPDTERRMLSDYRQEESDDIIENGHLNLTLEVLSCGPRVFEIPNFLSSVEVDHILHLATGLDLSESTTSGGDDGRDAESEDRRTRTSYNTWVHREMTPVVDAIYRRAADLLRIDEALFRYRGTSEWPNRGARRSLAESLQLVHYDPGQEYTAHHDFGYSEQQNPHQPARFATLLMYLNGGDGLIGGETQFPRWINAETAKGLNVVPEKGKAVLFYDQLPDGNMDDLSQHAALPVKVGEKWLMNLWIWDPIYEMD